MESSQDSYAYQVTPFLNRVQTAMAERFDNCRTLGPRLALDNILVGGIVHGRLGGESHRFSDDERGPRRGFLQRRVVKVCVDGSRASVAVPEEPSDRG